MRTIVIADGLTKEFLGTEEPFTESHRNIGQAEIERLLGSGRAYGGGPLPTFLRAVVEAARAPDGPRLVLLRRHGPLPDVLEPLVEGARQIGSGPDVIPTDELWAAIADRDEPPPPDERPGAEDVRFVLVGTHTDGRVLALAAYLRRVVGFGAVAVSPHLVGSSTPEAHFAALRHNFARIGVDVLLDLREIAEFAGLPPESVAGLHCVPPEIGPEETRAALDPEQRRIIELLCLNWTRAELRPLAGGYSGSLLFLAQGWKHGARTEPLVLKVDRRAQMRRELNGYHRVKDLFGKNVPTFGYPVSRGDLIGVGMELASMEGSPRTLQQTFESAETEEGLQRFLSRLDRSLALLSEKLYRNTVETTWVEPYRAFGLHAEKQVEYLRRNGAQVLSYLKSDVGATELVDAEPLARLLRRVAENPDGVESEVCLVHGDLNYANVICDEINNIWFIDWTHCAQAPLEQDFAKLENDVKFVMSKDFDVSELPRLRMVEEHLLSQRIPGDVEHLPDRLRFVKWDLRYRKILETVRRIRSACFALKSSEDWVVYRVALLRYATHNVSFDKRRGRGECEPGQLLHALYSVECLLYDLMTDDFHLKTRAERPESYPPRQRVPIDQAPWSVECPGYDPPYHVAEIVLDNDRARYGKAWADPEDFAAVREEPRVQRAEHRDSDGRPLNPYGRTGIAGRGLLGLWGPNLSVATIVLRPATQSGVPGILLGGVSELAVLELPKGFVLPSETAEDAVRRVLEQEVGWAPGETSPENTFEGFVYDARQTDNAWVEAQAYLLRPETPPAVFAPGGEFDEVRWWPLDAMTVNRIPSDQARFVRDCLPGLVESRWLTQDAADTLLAATG